MTKVEQAFAKRSFGLMLPEAGESSETVSSKSQEEIEEVHHVETKNSMIIDRFKQNLFKKVKPKD